jgi:OOP family OmpA-OmpF porin
MRWKILVVLMVSCPLLLGVVGDPAAEQMKDRIDLTTQPQVTPEDIIAALTPRPAPRTRGLKTRGIQPNLATIALTVHFAFDSAELLPQALPQLNALGQALQSPQLTPYHIRIEGHTDNIGAATYNVGLSERRAESVKQYLASNFGITDDRLVTVGRGKAEPLGDNNTSEGRQKNRRVEFVNIGK